MEQVIEQTIAALKKHAFVAEYVENKEAAKERLLTLIKEGQTVGIPGTASARETGIVEALKERGNTLYDHWDPDLNPMQGIQVRKSQLTCDVLLTSANALTQTGMLYNKDGIGNRVASTIFGPGSVIFIVGKNKIVPDLAAAEERVKKIAAPARAKEMNLPLPCAKTGECTDCDSPARICRATVILERKPSMTQIRVIIVGEDLGL